MEYATVRAAGITLSSAVFRRMSRAILRALMFLAGIAFLAPEAAAKDLELLTRYLVLPFLAQNFALTCGNNDPQFLSELPHGARSVVEFSEQIKREITADLTYAEAANVVLVAANTALQAARTQMRKLTPDYPKMDPEPLKQWCDADGRSYIIQVMQKDIREHAEFLKNIEAAKR